MKTALIILLTIESIVIMFFLTKTTHRVEYLEFKFDSLTVEKKRVDSILDIEARYAEREADRTMQILFENQKQDSILLSKIR